MSRRPRWTAYNAYDENAAPSDSNDSVPDHHRAVASTPHPYRNQDGRPKPSLRNIGAVRSQENVRLGQNTNTGSRTGSSYSNTSVSTSTSITGIGNGSSSDSGNSATGVPSQSSYGSSQYYYNGNDMIPFPVDPSEPHFYDRENLRPVPPDALPAGNRTRLNAYPHQNSVSESSDGEAAAPPPPAAPEVDNQAPAVEAPPQARTPPPRQRVAVPPYHIPGQSPDRLYGNFNLPPPFLPRQSPNRVPEVQTTESESSSSVASSAAESPYYNRLVYTPNPANQHVQMVPMNPIRRPPPTTGNPWQNNLQLDVPVSSYLPSPRVQRRSNPSVPPQVDPSQQRQSRSPTRSLAPQVGFPNPPRTPRSRSLSSQRSTRTARGLNTSERPSQPGKTKVAIKLKSLRIIVGELAEDNDEVIVVMTVPDAALEEYNPRDSNARTPRGGRRRTTKKRIHRDVNE